MHIEICYVDGCPNVQTVQERLAVALAATGHNDVHVLLRLVDSDDDATLLQFTGSPTILVDGVDPFAGTDAQIGLSCRLYHTPDGPAGAPTINQLIRALASVGWSARGRRCVEGIWRCG